MTIVQMPDLHVVGRDRFCYRRMATNAQLAEAVAHINALDSVPDAVFASCDLTDHGRAEEYDVFREILASLLSPVFVITSRGGIVGGGDQITRTKSSCRNFAAFTTQID